MFFVMHVIQYYTVFYSQSSGFRNHYLLVSNSSENEILILLLVKDDKLQCYDLATYVTRPSQLFGNFVIRTYRCLLLQYQYLLLYYQ